MTVEQRFFIPPSDIAGIEYECSNCHARQTVSLARFGRVLYQCPNCKEGMATAANPSSGKAADDTILHKFVDALKEMKNLTVKVRLEISGDQVK